MTCHEAKKLLEDEGRGGSPSVEDEALRLHLAACHRCSEAMKVTRLSSVLLGTLREEIEPGPSFYPRLRERLAAEGIRQPDAILLQAWGFARRLVPALAVGVGLLGAVMISLGGSRSSLPVQVGREREVHAFSLEELNLPAAVERPSKDQMLAFVLTQGEVRGARSEVPDATSGK